MNARDHFNPQPVDKIGYDCERLPIGEVTEMQIAFNCNLSDSEFAEFYLEETESGNISEISEEEWFDRFFSI